MIKKLFYFMISALLILNPLSVLADVLFEPEDSFYKAHADECTSERKYYEAQVTVFVLQRPDSKKGFSEAQEGSIFYIDWIYTDNDGNQWGLYDGIDISYWVEMSHLEPLYSHDEFIAEHASEIKQEDRTLNPQKKGFVVLYEYPGSTWISDILDTEWIREDSFTVHQIYLDDEGNTWGYMPYYMQHNGWVNLDNAVSSIEPERNAPHIFIPEDSPSSAPMIAIIMIGLCVLTGGIAWFTNKRRNKV